MLAIDVLSRILHVLTAITLVGGSIFTLLVLMPSFRAQGDSPHLGLAVAIIDRWKKFVHGGITLFLITGFYNYFRAMPLHMVADALRRRTGFDDMMQPLAVAVVGVLVLSVVSVFVGISSDVTPLRAWNAVVGQDDADVGERRFHQHHRDIAVGEITLIPSPSTLALMGLPLLGMARRRR